MRLTLSEVAEIVSGEPGGDGSLVVTGVAGLNEAGPGDLTFAKETLLEDAKRSKASAVLTPRRVEMNTAQIVVKDPYRAFVRVLEVAERELARLPSGIHPSSVVQEGVELGRNVSLGANAVVEVGSRIGARSAICANATVGANCEIGGDSVIHAGVAIRERVRIGNRTVVHNNTTIGGDGFGYLQVDGKHVKIPQIGGVRIGDDVEIGCNCTIDRGTVGDTVIGNGVKMDNHCHIAHNCRIGDGCLLVAYARMGGSVTLGRNVVLAEDVGITDHVSLGDNCIVTAASKVSKSWPAGSVLGGTPATGFDKAKRIMMLQRKLPQMAEQLREIRDVLGIS